MLDALVVPAVEDVPQNDPPPTPVAGRCYLVGSAPTGAWSGEASKIAQFTDAGWRFIAPTEGLSVTIKASGQSASWRGGAWEIGQVRGAALVIGGQQVVGARASAIAAPSGGSTVDSQARSAIALILASMRAHGLIES